MTRRAPAHRPPLAQHLRRLRLDATPTLDEVAARLARRMGPPPPRLGITQPELAARLRWHGLSTSAQTIASWESGAQAPSTRALVALAAVLDERTEVLLSLAATHPEKRSESL